MPPENPSPEGKRDTKRLEDYEGIDFGDLPFDVTFHAEGLRAFAALGLERNHVKPALRARNLVLVHFPSCRFAIGITASPIVQEQTERAQGGFAFEVIYRTEDAAEAGAVRTEVERYFRRHFPRRVIPGSPPNAAVGGEASEFSIYVAMCHDEMTQRLVD